MTEQSLSAAMKAEIHDWLYDTVGYTATANSEQELADRLARLAERHFAGQVNTGAEHYERVMLTCAALEGAMVNVEGMDSVYTLATYAEGAADHAQRCIASRERAPEREHTCVADGCEDPPRYCGAHAGVDTTVSDATDAATVTDEVYRLQGVLAEARGMARALQIKAYPCEQMETLDRVLAGIDDAKTYLGAEWGVQGKRGDRI